MGYQIITSDADLQTFCEQCQSSQYLALDTEFVRTRTWFPHCGLIQVCNGERTVLIDPLAITDWADFLQLMRKDSLVKVLHSCSEDLEVFKHLLGEIPSPIFDSQFAACLAGLGPTLGYGKLIKDMLGIELDKGESRTDWLKRPLTPMQLEYAANDVVYLYQIYPLLKEKLTGLQRYDWVLQESANLAHKKSSGLPAQYRYLLIKNSWQLQPSSLAVLQELTAWRYELAKKKDMAANFVIKETALLELAKRLPRTAPRLHAANVLSGKEIRLYGDSILQLVNKALSQPPEEYPARIKRLVDMSAYKKVSQSIRNDCIAVAQQHDLPVEILASKKQVNQFLKWLWFDVEECKLQNIKPDICVGWRNTLLQDVLQQYR